MRTLTLRGGERAAVIASQWRDAFAVVTRGRVQLELRDGRPGPVLGRDAAFWLRGTGVRALRNPGPRTARVRIIDGRTDMSSMPKTAVALPAGRARGLVVTGLSATFAAIVVTTVAAALARAAGADFEIPDGGESIPPAGFAVVTGFFSLVGVVIAAAFRRWSARPARRFVWTTVTLTGISLVPPFVCGADTGTVAALIGLHLVAAAVMIPALARALRTRAG
ncbi:DUF6069 family protein [Actinoplanes sp. NPDC049802]|uniref:DUF6069 family protein n=1 Tax=Actinoplanes sp. NPDC049802 TaxID=3154742 RepID=UPI0033E4C3FE